MYSIFSNVHMSLKSGGVLFFSMKTVWLRENCNIVNVNKGNFLNLKTHSQHCSLYACPSKAPEFCPKIPISLNVAR